MDRHRFLTFVVLAYAISWGLWLVAAVGGGRVPFLLGALGPMAAAAIVTAWTGRSLVAWIRPVWRWRVPVRWWLYALGLPALLYAVVTLVLQFIGSPVDWSLAADRLPAYLSTFVFVLFLGGALEEPGWRGFGLPVLQERYSPLRATLILGLVWGVWHVPVYGPAGFVVPLVLAFFYTAAVERHPQRGTVHPDARQLHSGAGPLHSHAPGTGLHAFARCPGLGDSRDLRCCRPCRRRSHPWPAGLPPDRAPDRPSGEEMTVARWHHSADPPSAPVLGFVIFGCRGRVSALRWFRTER